MSIVKAVADAHGGRVTIESAPGAGSTFTVRLPLQTETGAAAHPHGDPAGNRVDASPLAEAAEELA